MQGKNLGLSTVFDLNNYNNYNQCKVQMSYFMNYDYHNTDHKKQPQIKKKITDGCFKGKYFFIINRQVSRDLIFVYGLITT